LKPSVFIQKWVDITDIAMFSLVESPETRKKKQVLYDYLVALNEDISSGDFDTILPQADIPSSSTEPVQLELTVPDPRKYIDMQDNQDPYEDFDDHAINWDGYGLFWDIPLSQYMSHRSYPFKISTKIGSYL
jgi:hypothetical protein